MALTPTYSLPYQTLADSPHGPNLGKNLAEAVEAELERIDAGLGAKPRVRAWHSVSVPLPTGALVLVPFGSEQHKNVAVMHSTLANTSRLIVPAGTASNTCFDVRGQVTFSANTSGRRAVTVRKNAAGGGTGGTQVAVKSVPTTVGDLTTVDISFDIELNSDDYLEMFALQSSGASLTTAIGIDNTWMSMREAA